MPLREKENCYLYSLYHLSPAACHSSLWYLAFWAYLSRCSYLIMPCNSDGAADVIAFCEPCFRWFIPVLRLPFLLFICGRSSPASTAALLHFTALATGRTGCYIFGKGARRRAGGIGRTLKGVLGSVIIFYSPIG
jgi:hypothetical protein